MGNGKRAGNWKWVGTDLSRGSRGHAVGELVEVDVEGAEPHAGRDLGRRLPAVELRAGPIEESALGLVAHLGHDLVDPRHPLGPVFDQLVPGLVVLLLGGRLGLLDTTRRARAGPSRIFP